MTGFAIGLDPRQLDLLMPMHLVVDTGGCLLHAGPTLSKILGGDDPAGRPMDTVLDPGADWAACRERAAPGAAKMKMRLRTSGNPAVLAQVVQLVGGHWLINLSFGIGVVDAIGTHCLDHSDFAPTDLAVELLFLHEANRAVLSEWRSMAARLDRARGLAEERARTDALTGLGNRRALDDYLSRLAGHGAAFAVAMVDLDFLKRINDTFGHEMGDAAIVGLARSITRSVRGKDTAFRIGGDEFAVVFPGLEDPGIFTGIADRILLVLAEEWGRQGREHRLSASMGGVIVHRGDDRGPAAVLAAADAALYMSKNAGRARFTLGREEAG